MKARPNNILGVILVFLVLISARAADYNVSIGAFPSGFTPSSLSINTGDRVIWTNDDDFEHTVTSDNNSWPSQILFEGETFNITFITPGTYGYYDIFDGYTGTITVTDGGGGGNVAPTVDITAPTNGQMFNPYPATFTILATASDSDGTVANVQFFIEDSSIRTDTTSPYSATIGVFSPGTYRISAVATDDANAKATNTISIVINAPPTVSISSPANNTMFTAPASFVLQADASDSDGTIESVQFFRGVVSLGVVTSSPYTVDVNNLNSGTYTFSAVATDDYGLKVTNAVTVIVNALPTVSMLTPANGANFTAPYNGLIQATASDSDGSITNVQFFIGTNYIGNATKSPYVVLAPSLGVGSYTVNARATDNRGGSTTSASVNFTVSSKPVLSAVQSANGQASFNITGVAGQVYIIEASANLSTWVPISTNTAPSSTFLFTDASAAGAQRFYRVRNQ